MLAVTKIANPSLQRRRVVLLDNGAIGLDGGVARDGRPLAGVGDETKVNRRVLLEVVGLSRLGVGVEKEVEAICFLLDISLWLMQAQRNND